MRIPIPGKTAAIALAISGLALSGCATDGYGGYGSVSVGSGWYDDSYPGYGYYPGYYGYDYGYWGYPGYYYNPRNHRDRHHLKDRPRSGNWQGRPSVGSPDRNQWRGRTRAPSDGEGGRWQGRRSIQPDQARPPQPQISRPQVRPAQPPREGRWQGGGQIRQPQLPTRQGWQRR